MPTLYEEEEEESKEKLSEGHKSSFKYVERRPTYFREEDEEEEMERM